MLRSSRLHKVTVGERIINYRTMFWFGTVKYWLVKENCDF